MSPASADVITGLSAPSGEAYTISEEVTSVHAPFTYAFTAKPYLEPLVSPVTFM